MTQPSAIAGLFIVPCPDPQLHASPGQFLLAVPPTLDPYLPRVVFPFRIRNGNVESVLAAREVEGWSRNGDLELRGPFGRPFEIPGHGARALILGQDLQAVAHLITLVDELVTRECEVTVLCSPNEPLEHLLPAEVEYRESENVIQGASELADWADLLFACGQPQFYDQLRALATRDRYRLEKGWAQVLLRALPMPCGTGLCYACAFRTARGVILNCQHGPVIDLMDWITQT